MNDKTQILCGEIQKSFGLIEAVKKRIETTEDSELRCEIQTKLFFHMLEIREVMDEFEQIINAGTKPQEDPF